DASEASDLDSALLEDPPGQGVVQWTVFNKIDALDGPGLEEFKAKGRVSQPAYFISALTGAGIDELLAAIGRFAEQCFSLEPALVTRERQRSRLQEVLVSLKRASEAAKERVGEELVAEHLRAAIVSLGKLTGRVD